MDAEFKKAHHFIRTYLGKDQIYTDEEIQEQEKANRFDYKFIPDLDFREYLEHVSLENHRSNDFMAAYPVIVKDDQHFLHFKNQQHPFSVLWEYQNLLYQVNFNINKCSQPFDHFFEKNYFHLTGVMDSKNNSILILPYFNEIRY